MRYKIMLGCALTALATASPALAVTESYVLIAAAPGKMETVMNSPWGFGNCKARVHSFQSDEIIAHIACSDTASLNKVVSKDIPAKEGVEGVTVWSVKP